MMDEIVGVEFDWLCCDGHGRVALLTTAGGGHVSLFAASRWEAYSKAIEALMAMPVRGRAVQAPLLPAGYPNLWLVLAERGLYAYDSDLGGGRRSA